MIQCFMVALGGGIGAIFRFYIDKYKKCYLIKHL